MKFGILFLLFLFSGLTFSKANELNNDSLKRYKEMIFKYKDSILVEKLAVVNTEINKIKEGSDMQIYGEFDYWATPSEFLKNGGDCEDYAIAKYFALVQMGIEKDKLFFMVADDSKIKDGSKHLVLLYVESIEYSPLVLDNLIPQIMPLNKRDSLTPLFVFNESVSYRLNKNHFLSKIDINWGEDNRLKVLFSKLNKKESL